MSANGRLALKFTPPPPPCSPFPAGCARQALLSAFWDLRMLFLVMAFVFVITAIMAQVRAGGFRGAPAATRTPKGQREYCPGCSEAPRPPRPAPRIPSSAAMVTCQPSIWLTGGHARCPSLGTPLLGEHARCPVALDEGHRGSRPAWGPPPWIHIGGATVPAVPAIQTGESGPGPGLGPGLGTGPGQRWPGKWCAHGAQG